MATGTLESRGRREPDRCYRWVRLASTSDYDARTLARKIRVTVRQLERYFQEDFGRTPRDWLFEQRLIAARYLLMENTSVKSVGLRLHFKQPSHFTRAFKRVYEMTPTEFLNRFRPQHPEPD